VQKQTRRRTLSPAPTRSGIPAERARAFEPNDLRRGGGLASPLVEGATGSPDTLQRTFYDVRVITSSDGILAMEVEPLESIKFLDDNATEIVFQFKELP
jgi:hypothetical protein